jgi:hypothetical protein
MMQLLRGLKGQRWYIDVVSVGKDAKSQIESGFVYIFRKGMV